MNTSIVRELDKSGPCNLPREVGAAAPAALSASRTACRRRSDPQTGGQSRSNSQPKSQCRIIYLRPCTFAPTLQRYNVHFATDLCERDNPFSASTSPPPPLPRPDVYPCCTLSINGGLPSLQKPLQQPQQPSSPAAGSPAVLLFLPGVESCHKSNRLLVWRTPAPRNSATRLDCRAVGTGLCGHIVLNSPRQASGRASGWASGVCIFAGSHCLLG